MVLVEPEWNDTAIVAEQVTLNVTVAVVEVTSSFHAPILISTVIVAVDCSSVV